MRVLKYSNQEKKFQQTASVEFLTRTIALVNRLCNDLKTLGQIKCSFATATAGFSLRCHKS